MNLAEMARSCHDCDFHIRLLQLDERDREQTLLQDALALAVEATAARHGRVELHGDDPDGETRSRQIHRYGSEEAILTPHNSNRGPRPQLEVAIGGTNPIGVITLWGEVSAAPFSAADRTRVALIARQLATRLELLAVTDEALSYREAMRQFKRRFLQEALERNNWNIAKTARQLDIRRAHLYNLLADHGLRRPKRQAA